MTALTTAVAAGSAVLLAAPAAHAKTVDVDYQCKTPIGQKGAVSPINIKSTKSGEGYKLSMSFQKGVSSSPIELGKGAMNPSADIELGGADSGTVKVKGPPNDKPIPANTPIKISTLSGDYAPKKSGKVTFTAGTLTIKAMGTTTTCKPKKKPEPALSLDVQGAGGNGGSGGGGSDGGGAASGGTGGDSGTGGNQAAPGGGNSELPQTGPADSAVALGTLGGTVLLSGVAGALWLSRRRTTARTR